MTISEEVIEEIKKDFKRSWEKTKEEHPGEENDKKEVEDD